MPLDLDVALALASQQGRAADFPSRTVTIVVPYAAGGVTDRYTRAVAEHLTKAWGQSVIIENRAGGGTLIGTQVVSIAKPDGHTLLATRFGFTSNPVLRRNLPYARDALRPVALYGANPNLLIISARSSIRSLEDVVRTAKSSEGALKLASSGNGSSPHIAAELFAKLVGASITHLPYRGQSPAMNDVVSGVADGMFDGLSAMPLVRDGSLRAIAIASAKRSPLAPDLPTFRELGIDLVFGSWFGVLAPAGVPDAIVDKINADINAALRDPGVRATFDRAGLIPSPGTAADFGRFLQSETDRLKALVDGGAKIAFE
ncbi:MAG: Bug family tripartite tricarboxylate transporter substrate binding protein [Lautropia sp.]